MLLIFATPLVPVASAQMQDPFDPSITPGTNNTGTATSLAATDEDGRRLTMLGVLGVSLVRGVEVTSGGIDGQSEVTVTLSSNLTGDANPALTLAAFRGQIDLVSILQQHMATPGAHMPMSGTTASSFAPEGSMGSMMGTTTAGMPGSYGGETFDIESFIDQLQIGSTTLDEGWTSDEQITIPVVEDAGNNVTGSNFAAASGDTEIVVVIVLPNTTAEQETGAQEEQTIDGSLIP